MLYGVIMPINLLENQENGGIDAEGVFLFETDDPDFSDRSLFDVRFKMQRVVFRKALFC